MRGAGRRLRRRVCRGRRRKRSGDDRRRVRRDGGSKGLIVCMYVCVCMRDMAGLEDFV